MYLGCLILSVVLIIADQLIKAWAFTDLQAIGTIPLIQDVLHLTYSENRGAAFSILYGKTELLMIVNTILIIVLLYILLSKKLTHPLAVFSTTLIVSGGIGNYLAHFRAVLFPLLFAPHSLHIGSKAFRFKRKLFRRFRDVNAALHA